GQDGARGRNLLDGRELPPKATGRLAAGSRLRIETPGGGGFGGPPDADPSPVG
ncbi:MAG TPA: hydantoinase B/oxoprolinase family protein, partial [Solirubrobacteraceae bacterium]|nr:hydantoinase B/oxoprolinase family protein [Solirubrobacteraceae bacterium]